MNRHSFLRLSLTGAALLAALVVLPVSSASADDLGSAQLGLKVKLTLLQKLGVDALHIDVDSVEGAVTLNGTVDKRPTSELAQTIAKSVAGVKSVADKIELKEYQAEGKATVAVAETERSLKDGLLQVKLRTALLNSLGADGLKIGTEAASGTVTLRFPKEMTAPMKKKASAAAKLVIGVSKVITIAKV